MTDDTALRKRLDASMPSALELVPKRCRALAPMSAGKGKELAGGEIPRMCGNDVEKSGLDLRVTKGLKRFKMGRCDVHSERIPAVSSRSSRMRRSRDESSERQYSEKPAAAFSANARGR